MSCAVRAFGRTGRFPTKKIQAYCRYLSQIGNQVPARPLPPVISDPKDQAVIEAAVAGEAHAICTSDAHFYKTPAQDLLERRGILVLTDRALLTLFEDKP